MNFRFTAVEAKLNRAELRWKGLRLLRYSSMLGIAVCFLLLALGAGILRGWVRTRPGALMMLGSIAGTTFIAWGSLIVKLANRRADRGRLAAALEHKNRRLLDRLNTLVFLESETRQLGAESFARRIAGQAQRLFAQKGPASPFSAFPALSWLGIFAAVLAATVVLNHHFSPWQHLAASPTAMVASPAHTTGPIELARHAPETNRAWGEIRITDPGADLTVTKVDVVPLQIEAAANRHLTNVSWFSTVNGAEEIPHPLPPPADPCYASYQPSIYLDELQLSDWDVVSYYARAATDRNQAYASQVFFLEVRPFREDILKLPGGQGGQAYQTLSEVSSLIGRQQQIIRQTHHHVQQPPDSETLRAQDRKKLAGAETDLGESAQHLYANLAAEMENKPIGDALDNLAKAQLSLNQAGSSLINNALDEGQNLERRALAELVAARKMFQKAVSDNPGAFASTSADESPSPIADASQKLHKMAEFRDEAKAAQGFVQQSLEQQKKLEEETRLKPRSEQPDLGDQERQLQKALADFQTQHPQPFNGAQTQSRQVQQALAQAAGQLEQPDADGRSGVQNATRALESLNNALQKQAADQQLADAYKLKQMLDRQRQVFAQRAQTNNGLSAEDLQSTARQARQTLEQLKKSAEQEPTRDSFGQPLRDALSGEQKVDLDARLLQLEQSQDEASQKRQAAAAAEGLGKVSDAFKASQPESLQMAHKSDALTPPDKDRLAQGAAELDSLIKELEKVEQLPSDNQAKQGQQALHDLQAGLRNKFGDDAVGDQLMAHLQQTLRQTPMDPADLKQLLQQIQRFSLDSSEQLARKEDQPEINNIDPSRLPPAYRGPIQTYFEKLSEP